MSDPKYTAKPRLNTKEIADIYARKNFEELRDYFEAQNQMQDFQHREITVTEAVTEQIFKHDLGFIPKDLIVTKIVGADVTLNYGKFTTNQINFSTTGPTTFRLYFGRYFKDPTSTPSDDAPDDFQTFSAGTSATGETSASSASPFLSGMVMAWAGATAPAGWYLCDGSLKSRTDDSALFTAIGTNHGTGNGSSTFNLPDYRGRALRGVSGTSANDPDKATRTAMNTGGNTGNEVGSVQGDAMQTHDHAGASHTHDQGTLTANIHHSGGLLRFREVSSPSSWTKNAQISVSGAGSSGSESTGTDVIGVTGGGGGGDTGTPQNTSGESRMKNANVNWIIKA